MLRWAALSLLPVVACDHTTRTATAAQLSPPSKPVSSANASPERFPPRLHIRYTETNVWADGRRQERVVNLRARWLRDEGPRHIYEERSDSADYGTAITFYGDALGNLEITDPQTKQLARLEPPQIVVPPSPHVGTRWASGHRIGERVSSTMRECEILEGARCATGITSHCKSHLASGNVVELNVHYCDGVGYVGEDALVTDAEGHEKMREFVDKVTDVTN